MPLTRRAFTLGAAAAFQANAQAPAQAPRATPLICLFSECLPKIHYSELGGILRDMGFGGCDLTVRPGGHVEPVLSAADMYRAVEAIRAETVDVPVITTASTSTADSTLPNVLALCGRMKVPLFKMGYWPYRPTDRIETRIEEVRRDVTGLVSFGQGYHMVAAFHNRSGDFVGQAVWDIREIISGMEPDRIGYCFDPSNATAEGGVAGWSIALRMALPRIKMVTVQDFNWVKEGGKQTMRMCPLGEGIVDWPRVFAMLANGGFTGPLSLYVSYEPQNQIAAITRDLAFVKKHVAAAYGSAPDKL